MSLGYKSAKTFFFPSLRISIKCAISDRASLRLQRNTRIKTQSERHRTQDDMKSKTTPAYRAPEMWDCWRFQKPPGMATSVGTRMFLRARV